MYAIWSCSPPIAVECSCEMQSSFSAPTSVPFPAVVNVRTSTASSELNAAVNVESRSFSLPDDIKTIADSGKAPAMQMYNHVTLLVARIANLEEIANGIKASELTAALARWG